MSKQTDCPMCYSIERTYRSEHNGREYIDIAHRNIASLDDARIYADAYRSRSYEVRILAHPAIPYTIPYTPHEVA